ncbi:MAG: 2-C-methyl-D-erythritol 2,4-cyclodiphosphate synthase [Paenibacillaceae bacterium]|jgi:2-C-methyl-D-erythritol 2,4-cyclodiphosphate synthase/2-C-methyl-D-erythritol 4-phosphate cytidylyltransferase|nr:2-C-methyl-D-erythritol 2,4-cyclodiphosphate synthase [Paenibacillaceae bacterium]
MGAGVKKQYRTIGGKPLYAYALDALCACPFDAIVLVIGADDDVHSSDARVRIVRGGATRQQSVYAGLCALDGVAWVCVHDGVRPLVTPTLIDRCVQDAIAHACTAVAAVRVADTLKRVDDTVTTISREHVWAVQTPQVFPYEQLLRAHALDVHATDDAMLMERIGERVRIVLGDGTNIKVTTEDDFAHVSRLLAPPSFRIGHGFDVHPWVEGRPCIIGGVRIDSDVGLGGHSDADVLLHAIADAVLGAIGEGDIGRHFPDTDERWRGADSLVLLSHVCTLAHRLHYHVVNVDCTVVAERPRIAPYVQSMRAHIARALCIHPDAVNVKATTSERLGFVGRHEGAVAHAVVLVTNRSRNGE